MYDFWFFFMYLIYEVEIFKIKKIINLKLLIHPRWPVQLLDGFDAGNLMLLIQ